MSLDADVSKIKNYTELCYYNDDEGNLQYNPVTKTLMFASMSVGLGSINWKNWEEFYRRIHALELAFGSSFCWVPDEESGELKQRWIIPQDVQDHIGLRVNVIDETMSEFRKRVYNIIMDEGNRELRKFKESVDA